MSDEQFKILESYINEGELENAKTYLENHNLENDVLSDLLFFASKVGSAVFVQFFLDQGAGYVNSSFYCTLVLKLTPFRSIYLSRIKEICRIDANSYCYSKKPPRSRPITNIVCFFYLWYFLIAY